MMNFVSAKNYKAALQDFSNILAEFIIQSQMLFPHYRASLPVINLRNGYGAVVFDIKHRFNHLEDQKICIEIPLSIKFNNKTYDVFSDYEAYRKNCISHGLAHLKKEAFELQLKSLQGILQEVSSAPSQIFEWIKNTGFWSMHTGQTTGLYDKDYKPAIANIYSNIADIEMLYNQCLTRFYNIL